MTPTSSVAESRWQLERGARVEADGAVHFSVWCPNHDDVRLRLLPPTPGGQAREIPMRRETDGTFRVRLDESAVGAGTDYMFVLPGFGPRPDPVSRWQPHGVHGASRVVDPAAFAWTDGGWRGLSSSDAILYELHVGTFTEEGTFDGVRSKLGHLRELGITAIELMPVAACPGRRNWGYDGVFLYAPFDAYGGPDGLKRLIDAAHQQGLAVVIDVVYNHLGPEGNYLRDFGPYFSSRYRTPWGDALNFDDAESDDVRRFFVDNALYWLSEYHADGLRLDAIHGIFDNGAKHVLAEISDAFHAEAARLGRRAFLIAESDLNDVKVIRPVEAGGFGMDAAWNDDFHHSLHAIVTGANRGYFSDFGSVAHLAKALREGHVYSGQRSMYRRRRHGNSAAHEPSDRFVICTQNHDQIANAYQGKRLASLVSRDRNKTAAAILFAAPGLPMLFMGEEMAETAPFHYFTCHTDPELAKAVREGRHEEYLTLLEEGGAESSWADPQDEETFRSSRLQWTKIADADRADMLRFYKDAIALRRSSRALREPDRALTQVTFHEASRSLIIERRAARLEGSSVQRPELPPPPAALPPAAVDGFSVVLLANLGTANVELALPDSAPTWRRAVATRAGFADAVPGGAAVSVPADAAVFYVGQPGSSDAKG